MFIYNIVILKKDNVLKRYAVVTLENINVIISLVI